MEQHTIRLAAIGLFVVVVAILDLKTRQVLVAIPVIAVLVGLGLAATSGLEPLGLHALATAVGAILLLPFVKLGGMGAGDALVLAAIGALGGWPFVLWAAWWGAIAGAGLALVAKWRGLRWFPYVPALAVGTLIALVGSDFGLIGI